MHIEIIQWSVISYYWVESNKKEMLRGSSKDSVKVGLSPFKKIALFTSMKAF